MIHTKEQQPGSGPLKDVLPQGQSVEFNGMHTPLTDDVSWKKEKTWSRKGARIGILGIVMICILLSAVVALAVLLFESRNDHPIREASLYEGVYDIPNVELMRISSDKYLRYTTTESKQTSTTPSYKNKEGEEAITESAMNSGREDTSTEVTSSNEHEETTTQNPNTLERKDTSAEITIEPEHQESTSSSEHEETSTERSQQMASDELLKEELQLLKDLEIPMNTSSNDTIVVSTFTLIDLELDFFNDTDYDELSEIDYGSTSEIIFGDASELEYGKISDEVYDDEDEDGDEGLFDDSDDSTLLQNELEMVPKSQWGGVPPISINLNTNPNPYVLITQTNSEPCFDQDSCSLTMKLIQTFDMDIQVFPDMCDNYYIGGDGTVYVGRGPNVTNCHVGFVRFKNIGISFIGDFNEYPPSVAQMKALEQLISVGVSEHFLDPDYKIIAHKEIKLPDSILMGPGKFLLEEINSMPHRCSYSCIENAISSDYDDDSSESYEFLRFIG